MSRCVMIVLCCVSVLLWFTQDRDISPVDRCFFLVGTEHFDKCVEEERLKDNGDENVKKDSRQDRQDRHERVR